LEPITARQALQRLNGKAGEASLHFVLASRTSVYVTADRRLGVESLRAIQTTEEWRFVFNDLSTGVKVYEVNSKKIRQISEENAAPSDVRDYPQIRDWKLDSDEVLSLAEEYGGHIQTGPMGGAGLTQLRMCNVDGTSVPLWFVPHRLGGFIFYIRADTGSAVFIKDHKAFLFTETVPDDVRKLTGFREHLARTPSTSDAYWESGETYSAPSVQNSVFPEKVLSSPESSSKSPRLPLVLAGLLTLAAIGTLIYSKYGWKQSVSEQSDAPAITSSATPTDAPARGSLSEASSPDESRSGVVEPLAAVTGSDLISVEGSATQGLDVPPTGSTSLEYVVKISITNTGDSTLTFDAVRAIFFSEVGGGQVMTTTNADGGAIRLAPGQKLSFDFDTDNYTDEILASADGAQILFAVKLELEGRRVGDVFLAELPAISTLPSDFERGVRGYALSFRAVEMREF
jgi:hypothetical protein